MSEQYVVVDLEMCRIPRTYRKELGGCAQELMQIGAVLLNDAYETIGEFNIYVAPVYGFLDKEISRLTHIRPEHLQGAPTFAEAVSCFLDWVPPEAVMVAWSGSDQAQLRKEAAAKGFTDPRLEPFLETCLDCQKLFGERIDIDRAYKLEEALYLTDIWEEGQLHDGLTDAKNTATLFAKLRTETDLKLNSYYETAKQKEVEHLQSNLGDMLSGLKLN